MAALRGNRPWIPRSVPLCGGGTVAGNLMYSACGCPARARHRTDAELVTAHDPLRARFLRAAALTRVLPPFGWTAHDDGISIEITIATLSDASEIMMAPQDPWPVAERLAGRRIDLPEAGLAG